MADEPSPLDKLGITEAQFQQIMARRQVLGMRRKHTVVVPLAIFNAYKDIAAAERAGDISHEAARVEFEQRVLPHIRFPDFYNAERGDAIELDYARPARRIITEAN